MDLMKVKWSLNIKVVTFFVLIILCLKTIFGMNIPLITFGIGSLNISLDDVKVYQKQNSQKCVKTLKLQFA